VSQRSSSEKSRQPHRPQHIPVEDVYRTSGKLSDPTGCPTCGASYQHGRWTWESAPQEAASVECPACRRTADCFPAGILSIEGAFAATHRQEIESCLRHVDERDRAEHPLSRIMSIESGADGRLTVTTTDARLARTLGTALLHAYRGCLEQPRPDAQGPTRVHWKKE